MSKTTDLNGPRPSPFRTLPAEGENQEYSQTWFPICLSTEVTPGKIVTKEFLNGKIVVYRDQGGAARVLSPYCLHLGAHLGLGTVVEGRIQCPYHKWEYDLQGKCVKTGCGDPAPAGARLFSFPVRERWGLIWAFNGETAHWELPDFRYPDHELLIETAVMGPFPVDPWVVMCNTPDVQHIEILHEMRLDQPIRLSDYRWSDHGFRVDAVGTHWLNRRFEWTWGITGTNIFFQEGPLDGRYFGIMTPMSLERPGNSTVYTIVAVLKGDGSEEALKLARRWAHEAHRLEMEVAAQDVEIFAQSRFRQGYLTAADAGLSRFFDYLRAYPRANPAGNFIT